MASSWVMASSSSPAGSNLTRESSIYTLPIGDPQVSIGVGVGGGDRSRALGSMNMEDLLRNIYGDIAAEAPGIAAAAAAAAEAEGAESKAAAAEEEEVGGMTLEDFLTRAGAVGEEDVRVPSGSGQGVFGVEAVVGFGDGAEGVGMGSGERVGRGRKRPILEPADRAALQRQKRMIKNRESAARSRERKQAYIVELESLVTQLEEENAQLVRYEEEQRKKRLKQLMENLIPVTLGRKPRRLLRRTSSLEW